MNDNKNGTTSDYVTNNNANEQTENRISLQQAKELTLNLINPETLSSFKSISSTIDWFLNSSTKTDPLTLAEKRLIAGYQLYQLICKYREKYRLENVTDNLKVSENYIELLKVGEIMPDAEQLKRFSQVLGRKVYTIYNFEKDDKFIELTNRLCSGKLVGFYDICRFLDLISSFIMANERAEEEENKQKKLAS